jgi:hypothetical protein
MPPTCRVVRSELCHRPDRPAALSLHVFRQTGRPIVAGTINVKPGGVKENLRGFSHCAVLSFVEDESF